MNNNKSLSNIFIAGVSLLIVLIMAVCILNGCSGVNNQNSSTTKENTSNSANNESNLKVDCDSYCKEYLDPELVSVDENGVTIKIKAIENKEDNNASVYTRLSFTKFDFKGQKTSISTTTDPVYPSGYNVYINNQADTDGIVTLTKKEEEAILRYQNTNIKNIDEYKDLKIYFNLSLGRNSVWNGKPTSDDFKDCYLSVK